MAYNFPGPMGPAPRALRPIQVPGYGGAIPVSNGGTVSLIGFNFTPTPDGGFDVTRFSKGQLPTLTGVDLTSILRQCQVLAPLTGGSKGFPPPANKTCGLRNDGNIVPNPTNPSAHLPVRENGIDPRGFTANPFNNVGALQQLGGPDGVFNAVPQRGFASGAGCCMMPPTECNVGPMPTGYGVRKVPNYDAPWKSVARHEIPLHANDFKGQYDWRVPMAFPDVAHCPRHPYEAGQMRGVPPPPRRSNSPVPQRSMSPVPRPVIGPARRRSVTAISRRSLSPAPPDGCAQTAPLGRGRQNRPRSSRGGSNAPRPRRQSVSPVPDESIARGPGRGGRPVPPVAGANRKEQQMTREVLMDAHEVISKVRNELECRGDIKSRMRPQDFKQFKAAVTQLETALDAEKKSGHRRTRNQALTNYGAHPHNDYSPLRRRPQ